MKFIFNYNRKLKLQIKRHLLDNKNESITTETVRSMGDSLKKGC